MRFLLLTVLNLFTCTYLLSQPGIGIIRGKIIDYSTNQPIPGVNVVIPETSYGAATDENGEYRITNLPAGRYNLRASIIGYNSETKTDIVVNTARPAEIDFTLQQAPVELESVTVTSDYFQKNPSTVNSITHLDYEEIRRSPGGFEDVIRALSILPGIAQAEPGRNDLVVRGGAPSENLFIIDGVVVPNINHFGSQGATGGPLSYIDLNYVEDVTFSTGGFPANYGDKISSVLTINLSEGRKDRIGGKAVVSATQFGISAEGPLSDNTNFVFSARRSYLDFIFKAAGFGFVPEYYDVLTKTTMNLGRNNSLSFLFISAFDNIRYFNKTYDQRYDNSRTLGNDQIQYVTALSYKHLFDNGFYNLSLSRNYNDFNFSQKDTLQNPIFLNNSLEKENTLKGDVVYKPNRNSEFNFGAYLKYIQFESEIKFPFFRTSFGDSLSINQLANNSSFFKAETFIQYTNRLNDWFGINTGLRLDYFNGINKPFSISPRFALSFYPDLVTSINLSTGLYHQSPSYIWLIGDERNKDLKYIRALHVILGIERRLREDTQIRIEGFGKFYENYPASTVRPYLVLSNTGAGFGGSEENFSSFGLEPLVSKGKGIVRGVEISIQKKSSKIPYYGIASFTYSKSSFTALDGIDRPGSFDQNLIINFSGGYIFNKNWEAAFKFRMATGQPYTPFNNDGSQSINLYNSERLKPSHSLDFRVDRRWNFNNWALVAYVDIQNVYNRKNPNSIRWDERNNTLDESSAIGILPSIGISAEF